MKEQSLSQSVRWFINQRKQRKPLHKKQNPDHLTNRRNSLTRNWRPSNQSQSLEWILTTKMSYASTPNSYMMLQYRSQQVWTTPTSTNFIMACSTPARLWCTESKLRRKKMRTNANAIFNENLLKFTWPYRVDGNSHFYTTADQFYLELEECEQGYNGLLL